MLDRFWIGEQKGKRIVQFGGVILRKFGCIKVQILTFCIDMFMTKILEVPPARLFCALSLWGCLSPPPRCLCSCGFRRQTYCIHGVCSCILIIAYRGTILTPTDTFRKWLDFSSKAGGYRQLTRYNTGLDKHDETYASTLYESWLWKLR